MVYVRALLASLIALAVAVAPVAAMVVSGTAARTANAAVSHPCHGKAVHGTPGDADNATVPRHHQHKTSHQTEKSSCLDCDDKGQVSCIGDGGKCCKLTAIVADLPVVIGPVETADFEGKPPTLMGWRMRPSPPPPRV